MAISMWLLLYRRSWKARKNKGLNDCSRNQNIIWLLVLIWAIFTSSSAKHEVTMSDSSS